MTILITTEPILGKIQKHFKNFKQHLILKIQNIMYEHSIHFGKL